MNWNLPRGFWRSLFGSNRASVGKKRTAARPPRRRPVLEALEDRSLPSGGLTPMAYTQFAQTDGSRPVTINVLNNDWAPGGPHSIMTNSVCLMSNPQHGKVSVDCNTGQVTYTANAGFVGTDTFTYTFQDVQGATSTTGTVVLQVVRPTAADDWTDTDGTTPVTISVLSVDTDPEGNQNLIPSSISIVTGPQHGRLNINPSTGNVTYTCTSSTFMGTDSFQYTVRDVEGATSNVATVYVRVNRPTAGDDLATFTGTTPVAIDVLANDTDPDGNQHIVTSSVTVVSAPQHGKVSVNTSTGTITYTANAGFNGTDSFKYTIMDDNGATSLPATVTVTGFQPGTMNGSYTDTDGSTPVTLNVLSVDFVTSPGGSPQGNVTLVPGSVKITSKPADGQVVVDPSTGNITYTCTVAGFLGTDHFQYTVQDTKGNTYGPTTATVRVNRPTAADDWSDTDGTTPVTIDVLANDTDPDGNQHLVPSSVAVVAGPQHGQVSVDPTTGAITYTANSTFMGTDSYQYTVMDDNGATSNVATVYVRVNRPTAASYYVTTAGSTAAVINVVANSTDPDGNQHLVPSTVTVVSGPQHGHTTVNATTGAITYTPNAGWTGVDTFQYTITDDNGGVSLPATVTVNTMAPTARGIAAAVQNTSPMVLDVLADASDPHGSNALMPTGVQVTQMPQHGRIWIDPRTGSITYTADKGYIGTDSFKYTVADRYGAISTPATITLNVGS